MRTIVTTLSFALAGAAFACGPAAAQAPVEPVAVEAPIVGLDGQSHGRVILRQAPVGVLIRVEAEGLDEGAHGLHLHETGACEAPFDSAGDHFNPADAPHGFFAPGGPEAGDLPNLHVPATGAVTFEAHNPLLSLQPEDEATLLDADGSALIIHAAPDDYLTQPGGGAGDRIACAAFRG